jgi:hypothetical protein
MPGVPKFWAKLCKADLRTRLENVAGILNPTPVLMGIEVNKVLVLIALMPPDMLA